MQVSEYDYELPEELIAQMPADKRENSRMLVLDPVSRTIEHKHFYDIVDLLDENTLLVMNNTKVLPARLYGTKDTGARIEVFLLEPKAGVNEGINKGVKDGVKGGKNWSCLIKPSKRIKPDTIIKISDELSVRAIKRLEEDGEWLVEMIYDGDLFEILHKVGNIPLPPYIERKLQTDEIKKFDTERYQTVYSKELGSAAAPTAGLHFTNEILEEIKLMGVKIVFVTLHVGLGTFRPV